VFRIEFFIFIFLIIYKFYDGPIPNPSPKLGREFRHENSENMFQNEHTSELAG
jgi:hypothetical protein